MADQGRLACAQGAVRKDRFTEYGDLSSTGTFLYLKNTVAALRFPVRKRRQSAGTDCGWSEGRGDRIGERSDKKVIKLLKSFLASMQGNY